VIVAEESKRSLRVLDFDCECRPLAWYGGDFVTKQPTAIAWKFVGKREKVSVAWIGDSDRSSNVLDEEIEMLETFREAYLDAEVVTGHYIRGFDLPLLNGAMMRLGLEGLDDKLTQDTKLDLNRGSGLSKSQENLGAMFELDHPKISMNTSLWAAGNMLLPHGIEAAKKRAIGDVEQHLELRQKMLDLGLLAPPRNWTARSSGQGSYHA
jgi:DNA polymerase elongation subunit (family B)